MDLRMWRRYFRPLKWYVLHYSGSIRIDFGAFFQCYLNVCCFLTLKGRHTITTAHSYLLALERGDCLPQIGKALLDVVPPPPLQGIVMRPLLGLQTNRRNVNKGKSLRRYS